MKDTPFEEPTPAGGQDDVRGERAARSYAGAKAGSEPEDGVNETDDMSAPETDGSGDATAPGAGVADDGAPGGQVRRPSSRIKRQVGALLSGSILSKAEVRKFYPYMLLLAFLMLLYIANVFKMQQLHKQHDRLAAEVKELRAKSLTLSSIRMNATRQSEILKELKNRGIDLEESVTPPKIINK